MAKKVLIIEDEDSLSELIKVNLEACGFCTIQAMDGETGLKKTLAEMPDVIILDIRLPGLNGWEVCRRLKTDSHTRDIPVIFLSASTSKDNESRSKEVGGAIFVTKPFDAALLPKIVDKILCESGRE